MCGLYDINVLPPAAPGAGFGYTITRTDLTDWSYGSGRTFGSKNEALRAGFWALRMLLTEKAQLNGGHRKRPRDPAQFA